MCNLRHPVTTPGPSTADYGAGVGPDGTDPGPSKTVTPGADVTTMQPTKFAKLLKVVMPVVQGGLAGGFGGNWRQPGSGFQAAQGFFQNQTNNALQQKEMGLRTQQMQNQQANLQSEAQLRQQQMNLDRAKANVAGGTYDHEDASGNRFRYRTNPDTGEEQQLGPDPLPDRYSKFDSDQGQMILDTRSGHVSRAEMEEPTEHERTGDDADDNQPQTPATLPLHPPVKPQPEHVLSQGSELVDSTGKVVAKGAPKPVKPSKPTASDKKTAVQGKAETYADATLKAFNGDVDKADDFVNNSKTMDPAVKAQVRKLIRDAGKKAPVPKRRFNFTPGGTSQQQQLTAPGN